jgi:GTP cyclohydrolase I
MPGKGAILSRMESTSLSDTRPPERPYSHKEASHALELAPATLRAWERSPSLPVEELEMGSVSSPLDVFTISPTRRLPRLAPDEVLVGQGLHTGAPSPEAALRLAVSQILAGIGEDPAREGLRDTPRRVAAMYGELLGGYKDDLDTIVNEARFDVEHGVGEMVLASDIAYVSMCEHHMLPFTGKAHVAYLPRERVIGLSKIPRIVDMYAHRLQVQERLTNEIAGALEKAIDPSGVMVMLEGEHSCAALRGVKKKGMKMVTVAQRGDFREDRNLREEFYRLLGR